ncbi:hypothetical protein H4582DRAFT_2089739 [Lactarius indigo]|nr:hypothetical protein H4582DRAFT_2089739 [Lactarius indigo]
MIDLYVALEPYSTPTTRGTSHLLPLPSYIYSRAPPLQRRYVAYSSKEKVAELVAPRPGTLKLVNSWFEHHGVPPNDLLSASYRFYRHVKTNEGLIVCAIGYVLPAALHGLVRTVVPDDVLCLPTHAEALTAQKLRRRTNGAGIEKACDGAIELRRW